MQTRAELCALVEGGVVEAKKSGISGGPIPYFLLLKLKGAIQPEGSANRAYLFEQDQVHSIFVSSICSFVCIFVYSLSLFVVFLLTCLFIYFDIVEVITKRQFFKKSRQFFFIYSFVFLFGFLVFFLFSSCFLLVFFVYLFVCLFYLLFVH